MSAPATEVSTVDILIVGAGPAGLYAAYYAGFRGLSIAVVDSLPEPGGQISALYPEKLLHDIAGFSAVRGRDLVDALVGQAAQFAPRYFLAEQAAELEHLPAGLAVTTDAGRRIECRAVVLTGGIGTFAPRPLPAGEEFLGRGLRYFVPKLDSLAGQDVLVVGGGDSAVDWALSLEPIASSVTLVHRRAAFRAHRHSVDRMHASGARVLTDREVRRLDGRDRVERAEIAHRVTGETETVDVQAVVAALGFTADLGPIAEWGVEIKDRRIVVDSRMWTGVPGVYAAGDITEYPGKVRLIAVGFGESATAVNNAAIHIDPGADLFPGHSTDAPAA
ncbi:NAD(P)/FAD-dependent oxidoreductase [Prauserella flavalba]|uniref:NAD(P)/FAD-dependent oxidoreductase n=1 Tax=Prauserella flavalba TaxID=1477506 RepID=UPI001FE339E5|nr:NAD(P)/FAD-dependent oxidoreductase [Prauserella flavalba]